MHVHYLRASRAIICSIGAVLWVKCNTYGLLTDRLYYIHIICTGRSRYVYSCVHRKTFLYTIFIFVVIIISIKNAQNDEAPIYIYIQY